MILLEPGRISSISLIVARNQADIENEIVFEYSQAQRRLNQQIDNVREFYKPLGKPVFTHFDSPIDDQIQIRVAQRMVRI